MGRAPLALSNTYTLERMQFLECHRGRLGKPKEVREEKSIEESRHIPGGGFENHRKENEKYPELMGEFYLPPDITI